MIAEARGEASEYRYLFSQPIPLKVFSHTPILYVCVHLCLSCVLSPHQLLVDRVSAYMHVFTLYSAVRPFGCSLIFGSYGAEGPELYLTEPSGVSWVSRSHGNL